MQALNITTKMQYIIALKTNNRFCKDQVFPNKAYWPDDCNPGQLVKNKGVKLGGWGVQSLLKNSHDLTKTNSTHEQVVLLILR